MKKTIIAAIVGGIVLFLWQFLSWTILDLHRPMQEYTPKQQQILDSLGKHLDEGFYYLPTYPAETSQKEAGKLMEQSIGKPWAQIYYHKSMSMNMGMNMARGLIIDIVAVFLLCYFLLQHSGDLKTTVISCIALGLISYFTTYYTNSIWFEYKTIPDLIDAVVSWGLVGIWLGWWLNRK